MSASSWTVTGSARASGPPPRAAYTSTARLHVSGSATTSLNPTAGGSRGRGPQPHVKGAEHVGLPGPLANACGGARVVHDRERDWAPRPAGPLGVHAEAERAIEPRAELTQVEGDAGAVRQDELLLAPL